MSPCTVRKNRQARQLFGRSLPGHFHEQSRPMPAVGGRSRPGGLKSTGPRSPRMRQPTQLPAGSSRRRREHKWSHSSSHHRIEYLPHFLVASAIADNVSSSTCQGISPWLSERMKPPPGAPFDIASFTALSASSGVHRRISMPLRFPMTVSRPEQAALIAPRSSSALAPMATVPVPARASMTGRQRPEARCVATGPAMRARQSLAMRDPVSR